MTEDSSPDFPSRQRFLDRLPLSADVSLGEERANAWTHAVAVVGSVVVATFLLRLGFAIGSPRTIISLAIFALTLLNLYLVSTLYHLAERGRVKRLFRLLDHLSILYLIAGSYSVVALLFIHGPVRVIILACEWGLALLGTLYKLFYLGRVRGLSIVLYLVMGWLALFAWRQMASIQAGELGYWLLAGGVAYTAGLIFFGMKRLRYHHAIWHLFVMAGSACHILGIYQATRALYG